MIFFISNNMLSPRIIKINRIPLDFICYALVKDMTMYRYRKNTIVFDKGKRRGNSVIYGALFCLNKANYYLDILDALNYCNKSRFCKNTIYDEQHRVTAMVTPIKPIDAKVLTLDGLQRLRYIECEDIEAEMYIANKANPDLLKIYHDNQRRRKVVSGCNPNIKRLINKGELDD